MVKKTLQFILPKVLEGFHSFPTNEITSSAQQRLKLLLASAIYQICTLLLKKKKFSLKKIKLLFMSP